MKIDLSEHAEGAILLTGLEEAIIGVVEEFGNGTRILYDKDKIIKILCERDSMTIEEAFKFYDFNILGLYASEQNAVFLQTKLIPYNNDGDWKFLIELE